MPDLSALLSPGSVAVIGASPDLSGLRGRTLKVMLRHPYRGRIYAVSRSHASVQGVQAYPSIDKLPERVDLAVLIIPARFVPEELERCGRAGVKAALVLASGFAEDANVDGAALQARIVEAARRYDIAVCGPNAEGFANLSLGLCATFSPVLEELDELFFAQPHPKGEFRQGKIAVVSQSGGVGFSFLDRGRPKGLAFSHVITTGNEACLETFDFIEHLLDEAGADVFVVFLESIRNAQSFRRAASKALAAGKPIVVAKIGESESGRRAAASHTAALAGTGASYRAMFRRFGLIEGSDTDELLDIAAAFARFGDRLPRGRRVGIATASGGAGGWMADACAAAGLEVPELEPEARGRIDAHLPSYGTSQNPVDGTAQAIRTIGYGELARLVSLSERVDAVVSVVTARATEVFQRERESLARLARETRKPILMWSYTLPAAETARIVAEAGLALCTDMRNCARALAALAEYAAVKEKFVVPSVSVDEARCKRVGARLVESAGAVLCEYEAAPLLGEYGIRFAASRLATSAQEAIAAAAALGRPVALKVQSPQIPHKTEAGAVALGVQGAETIAHAYADVLAAAQRVAGADIRGVLVQAMVPAGVEMLVGIHRDATFGPMLTLALGGIHAEALRDAALAPVPVSRGDAAKLLAALRGNALLEGADTEALIGLVVALSQFAAEHGERIAELDLNPVIVHPAGHGASAVDALIVKRQDSSPG
ncbi:MAG TPA: acetate--CoA ligase family protein [Burkholderiales bacterium]|jgi:acyl-CoA synthetase (NDP forming)|nr:acetate--CoA ligase family protein [Burkholderiales bacterium]